MLHLQWAKCSASQLLQLNRDILIHSVAVTQLYLYALKQENCVSNENNIVHNCFYSKSNTLENEQGLVLLRPDCFVSRCSAKWKMDDIWCKAMCCYSSHYLSCYCVALCTLSSPRIIIFILFNYKLIRLRQYDKLPVLHLSAIWIFANNHLFLFHIHKSA